MTNNNCIIENRTFTHLTDIQRGKLEPGFPGTPN